MYLTASKLHRNYKKNTYFGWQMASKAIPLLFKQIDNLQPMDTIDAELEIRGMESYIKNQKNAVEDNLLYIHLRLLEHLVRNIFHLSRLFCILQQFFCNYYHQQCIVF